MSDTGHSPKVEGVTLFPENFSEVRVEESNLPAILGKLVSAAEQADMSFQQVIDLLDVGLSIEALLLLIELRLEDKGKKALQRTVPKWTM